MTAAAVGAGAGAVMQVLVEKRDPRVS